MSRVPSGIHSLRSEPAAPPVPRTLDFVTVKRNLPLAGRSYGHWWVELDGAESYGWWPGRSPLRTRDLLLGSPGALNGVGPALGGSPPRDPYHGLPGDYEFHPVLVAERTDAEVRHAMRRFAMAFRGEWRWSTRPAMNCRLFQLALSTPWAWSTGPATTAVAVRAARRWRRCGASPPG